MLNNYREFDYQIFYCSHFHENSNQLSFSKSTSEAADVIVLVATTAGVHNYAVYDHTSLITRLAHQNTWANGDLI